MTKLLADYAFARSLLQEVRVSLTLKQATAESKRQDNEMKVKLLKRRKALALEDLENRRKQIMEDALNEAASIEKRCSY